MLGAPFILTDRLHAGVSQETPPVSDLSAILAAIQVLAKADEVMLVCRPWGSERLTVTASCLPGDRRLPEILHDLALPHEFESRWHYADALQIDTDVLLVGLPEGEPAAFRPALLFRFRGQIDHSSSGIEHILPAVRSLVVSHLDLTARYRRAQSQRRAALAVMQQNGCGVVVLRSDRTVILANAAAEALILEGDGLTLQAGTLRPTNYHHAVRFHTAIDCVAASSLTEGEERRSGIVMFLPRSHQDPLLAVITPTTQPDAGEAAAIVYLLGLAQNGVPGLGAICRAHGLSPVETRLVTHLVGGATIAEAASDMRIKAATARSYLKQIFAKTNTHRQVDLVQRFARYLRAIRGDFHFEAG